MSAPEIAGFTHLAHLGSGGYSDVHLYQQHRPRRQVAIKVIRDTMDQRQLARFTAEADTMASLAEHPCIVPVLAADVTADGRPYLVMRYYPPPDLGARVKQQPLTVAEALRTGIQIASAVETAHRAGVLHRDIKPANILMTRYHTPALTDFGIAGTLQYVEHDDEVGVSIPWSPPEMLNGRSNGSVASDVYSLGATIWNLLTGRSPFRSDDAGANSSVALQARIHQLPPPPTGIPGVPAALDRLLQQCLAKNPEHRPQSALDLARSLAAIEQAERLSRTDIVVLGTDLVVPDTAGDLVAGTVRRPAVPTALPANQTDVPGTRRRPVAPEAAPPTQVRGATPMSATPPRENASRPSRVRQWRAVAAAAVVLAGSVSAVLMLSSGPDRTPHSGPQPTPTPELGGGMSASYIVIGTPRIAGHQAVFPLTNKGRGAGVVLRWAPGSDSTGIAGQQRAVKGTRIMTPHLAGRTCVTVWAFLAGNSTPADTESRCL